MLNSMPITTAIMPHFIYSLLFLKTAPDYALIFTKYARVQFSYLWHMLNIMLVRKLVPHFVLYKSWLDYLIINVSIKTVLKIFPIMLAIALCLVLSETYYAQNYSGIIGLGPIANTLWITHLQNCWKCLLYMLYSICILITIFPE